MKNDDLILTILVCAGIVLLFTGLQYQYASMRKGKASMKKTDKSLSFVSPIAIDKAMKTIIQFAQSNGYKIDDFNESNSVIVLSDLTTMAGVAFANSGGYIYPVYLSKQTDNSILVEVGIKHKIFKLGYPPSAPLAKCFNGIKAALFVIS